MFQSGKKTNLSLIFIPNQQTASSCHVYHSKKPIPYSQALHLNRVFLENSSYDKCLNELRGMVNGAGALLKQRILKTRKHKRITFLTI